MPEINIDFTAPPTVGEFLGCDDFVRLIVGPFGSGKSSGCCMEGLRRAMEMPPSPCCEAYKRGEPCECKERIRKSRGAIVRNTLPQLRDTTMRTWREWIPEHLGHWKLSEKTFVMDFPLGDGTRVYCEVLFRALDDANDVRNLLSLELTWIYFNEWREINKSIHDAAQTRVGRYPRKEDVPRYWTGIFGDSNSFDTDHYLYKLFKEPDPDTGLPLEGHRIFEQPGGLEPHAENREHLDRCFDPDEQALARAAVRAGVENLRAPEAMVEARREQDEKLRAGEHEKPCRCYYLRMMRGKRQSWIDCYIHNKYVFAVDGRPIYDNFNPRIHVAEFELPKRLRLVYHGQDYGLTPAAVFAHVMADGQIRISHEFVAERMGALNFGIEAAKLAKVSFPEARLEGWGDPAGMAGSSTDEEKTPISVVNGCGLPTSSAPTNEYTLRRDAVSMCLGTLTMTGEPEILIHPRCKMLVKALAGGYCLRRKKISGDEQFHDKPDKENPFSHVAEAMQYLVVGLGRDRRVLDGGKEDPERVQSVVIHRSTGREIAEDGPRVSVSIRRSISRR